MPLCVITMYCSTCSPGVSCFFPAIQELQYFCLQFQDLILQSLYFFLTQLISSVRSCIVHSECPQEVVRLDALPVQSRAGRSKVDAPTMMAQGYAVIPPGIRSTVKHMKDVWSRTKMARTSPGARASGDLEDLFGEVVKSAHQGSNGSFPATTATSRRGDVHQPPHPLPHQAPHRVPARGGRRPR